MSFFGPYAQSPGQPLIDAFGRLRVSNPQTLFDGRTLRDKNSTSFVEKLTGTGTSTHRTNEASVRLATSAASDKVTRQSRWTVPYQPGKSDLLFMTFNPNGHEANVTKRAGLFNDDNGVFLEWDGDTAYFVVRSNVSGSPVETRIPQDEWNIDPMRGLGKNGNGLGRTLDLAATQILVIDVEWLGVGRVRFGFVIDGAIIYAHQALHANMALTSVYMSTATLPIRYEIEQTGAGSGYMDCICSTLIREGGESEPGLQRSQVRGSATAIASGSPEALIAIRLDAADIEAFARVVDATAISTGASANFRWYLVRNPTYTGGTAPSWVDVPNSVVEYDITRDGVWDGGGEVIASGLVSNDSGQLQFSRQTRADSFALGSDVDGNSDVIALIIDPLSNASFDGSISWLETT